MGYKIAVASTDGKVVNEHFGRCRAYVVLEVDEDAGTYRFDSIRNLEPACKGGEHEAAGFDVVVQALSDCRVVLTSQIGPAAEQYISTHGLESLEYGGFIEDAVQKIIQYYKRAGKR